MADPLEELNSTTKAQTITRSAAEATAEKLRKERQLPPPPGDRVGSMIAFEDMITWLSALSPKQFERISIYIYRWFPIINLRILDPTNATNIDKPTVIPNYDYMARTHGGGRYGFKLKDTQAGKIHFESSLEIPISQHPPVIDLATLDVEHKDNRAFVNQLKTQGKLDQNGKVVSDQQKQTTPTPNTLDPNSLVDKMFHAMQSANEAQLRELKQTLQGEQKTANNNTQLMIEMMKANDPTKTIAAVLQMLPKQQTDSSMTLVVPLIIEMMKSNQAFMTTMLTQMNKPEPASPYKDPFAFMEKAVSFIETRLANKGQQPVEDTTDKIIGAVERIGLPLVEVFMNATTAKKAIESGKPVPEMRPVTQIPTMVTDPQLQQPTVMQAPSDLIQLLSQFKGVLVNVISNKVEGAEFAQQLEDQYTMPVVNRIIAYGSDGLLAAMQAIPDLWQVIAPTPNDAAYIHEWVEDFVNYKAILSSREDK